MKVSYDPVDLDLPKVIDWLSKDSYWAFGRDPEIIKKSFTNSIPISVTGDDGSFLGVGRLVTDGYTFGWLCDVFVDPDSRGKGIGHIITKAAVEYFNHVPKFALLLKTRDAHGVYQDLGFAELENPNSWMARMQGY
jgi:GNAT superfamily N-acetyltransferase